MSENNNYIFYRRFPTYFDTHVFVQHLDSKDIPYIIKNEAIGTLMPQVFGGVEIWILSKDQEEVEELINHLEETNEAMADTLGFEDDVSEFDPGNRVCIHCGSKNTRIFEKEEDYSLFHKMFKKKSSVQTKWYCFHCRQKF